jgi:predicted nucleotidyltransferase
MIQHHLSWYTIDMKSPTSEQLDEILQRIVPVLHPLRVILFGSAARDEMGTDSDIDLLVIMPDGTHRLKTTMTLHGLFHGLNFPVDVIVATPSDLERHAHLPGFIYATVLREGRELYAA